MCFTSKIIPKKKIATKDIICYKVCSKKDDKYYALFYGNQYKVNKTYKLYRKLKIKIDRRHEKHNIHPYTLYKIYKGFHSFTTLKSTKIYYNDYKNPSSLLFILLPSTGKLCICHFVIPKGSIYYEAYETDKKGVYVSNKIKFIGEII